MCLLAVCILCVCEVSFQIFCQFLLVVCCIIIELLEFFIFPGYKSFVRYTFCECFSPSLWLSYSLSQWCPLMNTVYILNFDEVQIVSVFF